MSFDIQQLHPTMVARNDRLEADCEQRGWTIGATRVTADYGQQKALYNLYKSGRGNLAANPDALGAISPWGWQVHGSFHQIQTDTYSHAIDYTIHGCTWDEFHAVAHTHGIGFPLYAQGLGEPWHAQWWDERGIYIDHAGDDDMTPQQFADAIGAHIPSDGPFAGKVCVHLIGDDLDNLDGSGADYPLADAIKFTHQELKMKRLRG